MQRERQAQLLLARVRRQRNIALVRGRRHPESLRVHHAEEEEQHELEEMQPVTASSIEADVSEPLITKEDAILVRGPPDPEPLIKQKIVHGVAMPNRPATACTFGKLLKETHECRGLVSSTKDLGNIDSKVPITPGVGRPSMKGGTFHVRKIVYGLNRYYLKKQTLNHLEEIFIYSPSFTDMCSDSHFTSFGVKVFC